MLSHTRYIYISVAAACFLGVLATILRVPFVHQIDIWAATFGITHRTPALTSLAQLLTDSAETFMYIGITTLGILVGIAQKRWQYLGAALVSMSLGQIIRLSINESIHRMRPPSGNWLGFAHGYAFPSGHTASAVIGYGLMAWLLWQLAPKIKPLLILIATLLALSVGLSRIYLGVHWLTDVTAGILFGISWLALTAWIMAELSLRTQKHPSAPQPRPARQR